MLQKEAQDKGAAGQAEAQAALDNRFGGTRGRAASVIPEEVSEHTFV